MIEDVKDEWLPISKRDLIGIMVELSTETKFVLRAVAFICVVICQSEALIISLHGDFRKLKKCSRFICHLNCRLVWLHFVVSFFVGCDCQWVGHRTAASEYLHNVILFRFEDRLYVGKRKWNHRIPHLISSYNLGLVSHRVIRPWLICCVLSLYIEALRGYY